MKKFALYGGLGKDIATVMKMLGAKSFTREDVLDNTGYAYIYDDEDKHVYVEEENVIYENVGGYVSYNLDFFKKVNPYVIGDKVCLKGYVEELEVISLEWNEGGYIVYVLKGEDETLYKVLPRDIEKWVDLYQILSIDDEVYSPLIGSCTVDELFPHRIYLRQIANPNIIISLTNEGVYEMGGERLLFPSSEKRDWTDYKHRK